MCWTSPPSDCIIATTTACCSALESLRDLGNTVLVVEHDEDTIRRSDYVIDLGPGAGRHGGEVVASGTPQQIESFPRSLTGQYISGQKQVMYRYRAAADERQGHHDPGRAREQPETDRRQLSAGRDDGGDRRFGLGQIDAGE